MHQPNAPFQEDSAEKEEDRRELFTPNRQGWISRFRKGGRRDQTRYNKLPVLIKVFAGFTKTDGRIAKEEIDSILGFLRYDYPEAIYSELAILYQESLAESVDLTTMASELSGDLSLLDKVILGVQLYILISRSGSPKEALVQYYLFMTNLGIANEAIDLVYQLNAGSTEEAEPERVDLEEGPKPLESLRVSGEVTADLQVRSLSDGFALIAFRYHDLVLVKNIGRRSIIVRGQRLEPGEFSRIFSGQRVFIEERVITYQDFVFYFNSKKDLRTNRFFVSFSNDGRARVDRKASQDSVLEINYGLRVEVKALRSTKAHINGRRLSEGISVEASLDDRIILPDEREIRLGELCGRARELAGRFDLSPSKFVYLVSNNPNLLQQGDILLSASAAGEILLRITCNYDEKSGVLEVLRGETSISIDGVPVRERSALKDGDSIRIDQGQYLACYFSERIIEEQRSMISRLEVRDLAYAYDKRETALEGVSFSVARGEMVCVLGPSGCGKSTLLRILAGHLRPKQGRVLFNGYSLYANVENLRPYISFIPQEEAFDPLLTVEENIDCSATIRCPHLPRAERRKRRDGRLIELGLNERRHRLAGDPQNKNLSGGERKRLNAGMDMIGISDVFLFDEPTSGLSSKDSEYVLEIIRSLSQNKITLVSIHQPSARLFHLFHKAILLDRGGRLAFFGTPTEMIAYFQNARLEDTGDVPEEDPARCSPDIIFDVLEAPLRDLSGDIVFEQDSRGHLVPARRYTPTYWRDRFQSHHLMAEVSKDELKTELGEEATPRTLPNPPERGVRAEMLQFATQLRRAFLSKMRNRMNLVTTLLEAPALAILVAGVLRYSEDGEYTLASAFHIPSYIFLTLVIGMFLGLTNSADEIIRDRPLLHREKGHGTRVFWYILSKFLALSFFALVQCVVYLLIGNWILEIRDMFFAYLGWMLITSLCGVAIGLFISSLVRDTKTALNIIPLVLIPNIILGGALIKYEEMNRNLDFAYRIKRLLVADAGENVEPPSDLRVPAVCELMPLRWSYESVVISQDKLNPLARRQTALEEKINEIRNVPLDERTDEQNAQLDVVKEALSVVSSLATHNPDEMGDLVERVDAAVAEGKISYEDFLPEEGLPEDELVSIVDVYENQKIRDLVTKAEMEREDKYREVKPNVFFGIEKRYFGATIRTLTANALVLLACTCLILAIVWATLRAQLRRV